MSLARTLTESPPSIRWHLARIRTALLYRHAFGRIGEGTVIVSAKVLRGVEHIRIGAHCAIFDGAWLQTEQGGRLDIGDHTYLGHDVHIHAIDLVAIGDRCVLADGVFIGTADHDRLNRSAVHGTGPVRIGDDVFLGQHAVVLGGVTVGDRATIGAGAVVTRDIPPGAVAVGVPARIAKATGE